MDEPEASPPMSSGDPMRDETQDNPYGSSPEPARTLLEIRDELRRIAQEAGETRKQLERIAHLLSVR